MTSYTVGVNYISEYGEIQINSKVVASGTKVEFEEGGEVVITAMPYNAEWAIEKATDEYNGEYIDIKDQLADGQKYVINRISENHIINLGFYQAYYRVSTKVTGGKGTIIPEGDCLIQREEKCQLTFAPENGYKIDKVECNGNDITEKVIENGGVYTVDFNEEGWHISASFIEDEPVPPTPPTPTPTPTPEDKKNAEILTKLTEPLEVTISKAEELLANGQKDEAFNELVLADIIKRKGFDTFVGELI